MQKRPTDDSMIYGGSQFAITVNGQTGTESSGYISDSSLSHSSAGETASTNQYFSGPPYYQPAPERTRQSSCAPYLAGYLPPHTSASPVSTGSSTVYPYWTNGAHEATFPLLTTIPSADHTYNNSVLGYNDDMADIQLLPEYRDFTEQSELAVHMGSPETSSMGLSFDEPAYTNEYRYIEAYWNNIHPYFPIVHRPSFNPHTSSPLLKASMIALGAESLGATIDRTNARLVHERCIKVLKKVSRQMYKTYCRFHAQLLTECNDSVRSKARTRSGSAICRL